MQARANSLRIRVENLELPAIHPRMAFIHGALDKEIRLSFAQRIKGTLPEPYLHLITESKEKDTPEFKYSSEGKHENNRHHAHPAVLYLIH